MPSFFSYTYDLHTTLAVRGAGGYLTTKKGAWCGAVLVRSGAIFVDLFHFMLLFVIFLLLVNFISYFLLLKQGQSLLFFVTFFTVCNFFKLLFTVEKGQGLYCIHCARGERVRLDFFPFLFFLLKGRGVEVNVFFSPRYMKRWKEEGGKGYIFILEMFFFIVERLGRGRG